MWEAAGVGTSAELQNTEGRWSSQGGRQGACEYHGSVMGLVGWHVAAVHH